MSLNRPKPARYVAAQCPLRPGQPCTLCHPEAHLGPQDCPTVSIVMEDADLRGMLTHAAGSHANSPGG